MLTKKQIGKIQLTLGIVLFLATIIGSIFIVKDVYIDGLVTGVTGVTSTWGDVSKELNNTGAENSLIMGLIVENITLQGQITRMTTFLFAAIAFISIVLSIILILQGLTNLAKK